LETNACLAAAANDEVEGCTVDVQAEVIASRSTVWRHIRYRTTAPVRGWWALCWRRRTCR